MSLNPAAVDALKHAWHAIETEAARLKTRTLLDLFERQPDRFQQYHVTDGAALFDFSKTHIDEAALQALFDWAEARQLTKKIKAMRQGERINHTEDRSVLHMALRAKRSELYCIDGHNVMPEVHDALDAALDFAEAVRSGAYQTSRGQRIRSVINIGIGGSDLGPLLVTQALQPFAHAEIACHFVSTIDTANLADVLRQCDPHSTLIIVVSKTLSTQETLDNAKVAQAWLQKAGLTAEAIAQQMVAVSAQPERAAATGLHLGRIFLFWDWVGGRYSLWSSVSLIAMIALGRTAFESFFSGACAMDEHLQTQPLRQNIPVMQALLASWYQNFWAARSHCIAPYAYGLRRFPAYLQQLEMESNGKSVNHAGERITDYSTGAVIWGESGTNGQHAFFQLLHQGTDLIPCDFILFAQGQGDLVDGQLSLVANAIAQTEALMHGQTADAADPLREHKRLPGNRPSMTLAFDQLTPYHLGYLLAMYEHKTFVQGVLWDINSFDQFGVEGGKKLAKVITHDLQSDTVAQHDSSTLGLIAYYKKHQA